MKTSKNPVILFIAKTYLLSISMFFVFRLLLFFLEFDRLTFANNTLLNIFKAFIMGLRFDIVISGYILFLPILLILTEYILGKKSNLLHRILFYWIFLLFTIAFVVSAADIPYFHQFFSRFSVGAFEWIDSPKFVFNMLIEEPTYALFTLPFMVIDIIFYKLLKRIFRLLDTNFKSKLFLPARIGLSLTILALIFLGIRGRIQKKSPIRVGTAYFCQDPFLNQLGLNPTFTLMRSYLDSLDEHNQEVRLMDEREAIKNVQSYLHIKNPSKNYPILRKISPDTISNKRPNVVIIIMESMSAAKMKRHGNKDDLTPFLDSLSYKSLYFDHIYSAGEHTFNGIFSTLFSFPALYRQHTMKQIHQYSGISKTLKKLGYSTTYFTTHDAQFDNVSGFLHANHFDNIVSQADYPEKEVKTTLGVPDDYMFRFAIPYINDLQNKNKPFFVTFMTTSDHGPFYIPPYFKPKNNKIRQKIVEYADWSLKQFITNASKQSWFDSTIFVFIADHGAAINVQYPISLNYHHTPLLFYAPKWIKPSLRNNIGGQIDVFPTIMGLLKKPYINNTLGIDLLHEKRPFTIINGDDKQGVLDRDFLFVLQKNNRKLFKYNSSDRNNYINKYKNKAKEMETYLKSNLQTYQYLLKHNLTGTE